MKGNMSILLGNASATGTNASVSPADITPRNLVLAIFVLVSFLVGTAVNGLFLFMLQVKTKRTVNSLWFLHLILAYLISCLLLPFFAIYSLLGFRWVFDLAMCKVLNSLVSLGMFTTVFLLTIISLDRYLLVHHPVWSQYNRTISRAQRLITGVWLASLILSAPYLAFRETRELEDGRIECVNNYALSSDWDAPEVQALRSHIHLALFLVRFLLAFVIPFCIIMGCYCGIGWEIKKKRLVKNKKPFKVLVAAVTSFFICWLPYHLCEGSPLLTSMPEKILQALQLLEVLGVCSNICLTPILYLFVGEKFQQVFKISLGVLFKKGFVDALFIPEDDTNTGNMSLELKMKRTTIFFKNLA